MVLAIRAQWVRISMGVWVLACASVMCLLWSYANAGGAVGGLRAGWTVPAALERPDDRSMLVVFAHPKCPCTRATMAAIERLQRDAPGAFATRVVFYEPLDADPSWRRTALWARAERLVDAKAIPDPGGVMTSDAGAVVSGCTALFDLDGEPVFWGGVTPSRGHEGESVGLSALRSLLRGEGSAVRGASVFGCEIVGAGDRALGGCGGGVCDAG